MTYTLTEMKDKWVLMVRLLGERYSVAYDHKPTQSEIQDGVHSVRLASEYIT